MQKVVFPTSSRSALPFCGKAWERLFLPRELLCNLASVRDSIALYKGTERAGVLPLTIRNTGLQPDYRVRDRVITAGANFIESKR